MAGLEDLMRSDSAIEYSIAESPDRNGVRGPSVTTSTVRLAEPPSDVGNASA